MKDLTSQALADKLNVTRQTVRRWVLDGCPCRRDGAWRRFNLEAVRAWLAERFPNKTGG